MGALQGRPWRLLWRGRVHGVCTCPKARRSPQHAKNINSIDIRCVLTLGCGHVKGKWGDGRGWLHNTQVVYVRPDEVVDLLALLRLKVQLGLADEVSNVEDKRRPGVAPRRDFAVRVLRQDFLQAGERRGERVRSVAVMTATTRHI